MPNRELMTFNPSSPNKTKGIPAGDTGVADGSIWAKEGFFIGPTGESLQVYFQSLVDEVVLAIAVVEDNIADIEAVAAAIAAINTLSSALNEINIVATNIASVNTVAGDSAAIQAVAAALADISAVAGKLPEVSALADSIAAIDALGAITTELGVIYDNIASIITCANNIAAIIEAPSAAASANASKIEAAEHAAYAEADKVQTGLDRAATAADRIAVEDARDTVIALEESATDAEAIAVSAAATATTQAGIATAQATLSQGNANTTTALKNAVDAALVNAQAIVVSGDVSYTALPNQVPLANITGKIDPSWVPGALTPINAVDTSGAASGVLIPDNTQFALSDYMTRFHHEFIAETLPSEIELYRDGWNSYCITTDKRLRLNYGSDVFISEPMQINDSYTALAFAYADDGLVSTFRVVVNGPALGSALVSPVSKSRIDEIFSDGGYLWLASLGYGSPTNAGVNKLQNYGDAVGSLPTVAGDALPLAQATAPARPLAGRVPKGDTVRNQLLNTEDLGATYWSTKTNITTSLADPDNGMVVHELRDSVDSTDVAHLFGRAVVMTLNTNNTRRLLAKAGTKKIIEIDGDPSAAFRRAIRVDLEDGTILSNNNSFNTLVEASSEHPGFWEISFLATDNSASASRAFLIRILDDDGSRTYVGDGTGTVYVAKLYSERNNVNTGPYQRVGATLQDVTAPGVPVQEYLYFDLGDDALAGTVPAITDGEIIIAGRSGIWVDDLTVAAGTFSIGPTTYTGGPAGVLSQIGDFVGCAIHPDGFDALEKQALIDLFQSKGAGAEIAP